MKFLNITTTGVKIQQASTAMKFLNITGVKIQPNEISEYHNYWSKNTTSTASTGTYWSKNTTSTA